MGDGLELLLMRLEDSFLGSLSGQDGVPETLTSSLNVVLFLSGGSIELLSQELELRGGCIDSILKRSSHVRRNGSLKFLVESLQGGMQSLTAGLSLSNGGCSRVVNLGLNALEISFSLLDLGGDVGAVGGPPAIDACFNLQSSGLNSFSEVHLGFFVINHFLLEFIAKGDHGDHRLIRNGAANANLTGKGCFAREASKLPRHFVLIRATVESIAIVHADRNLIATRFEIDGGVGCVAAPEVVTELIAIDGNSVAVPAVAIRVRHDDIVSVTRQNRLIKNCAANANLTGKGCFA